MDAITTLAMLGIGDMKSLMDMKYRWLQAAFRTVGTNTDVRELVKAKLRGGGCPLI